jgi:DNA polymerase-3 subunit gamma/tau
MMGLPSLPHIQTMGQFSLYRRYRPQTFAEVVGQNHVTRTLQNALAEERVPHAFLFSGPRGTGKTSTARILAKALNCQQAPTREPCNVCTSCLEITEGSSLDVVEIDAASHGSVDDARELRERVANAPMGGRLKVYIIDECHMLTAAANNALLKVLEEPPSHVVFVFATTEQSKVLKTLQDRCQRYEFRTVDATAVEQRILQVCEAEGVAIDKPAAALLAARSAGSVRDALGLLEQAVMYSGSSVGVDDVARLLGSVDGEVLFEAVDLVSEQDAGACFAFTDRLIRSGQDPREFLRALIDHLRSLFLIQHTTAAREILDFPDEQLDRLRGQANRFGHGELLRILDLAGEAHLQLRQAVDNRLALEIAFARMAQPELHGSPASLLSRIERLERMAGLGTVGAAPAAPPSARAAPPSPPAAPPASPAGLPTLRVAPATPPAPAPAVPAPAAPAPAAPAPAAQRAVPADPSSVDIERIQRAWPAVLELVKKRKISAQAMLHPATPIEYADGELVLEFGPTSRFHRDQVAARGSGYLSHLVEAFYETFGVRPAVRCVLGQNEARETAERNGDQEAQPSPGAPGSANPKDPIDLIREGFAAEVVEES